MLTSVAIWAQSRGFTAKPELMTLEPVSGGSINQTAMLKFADRNPLFLKWNPGTAKAVFEAEATGLRELAKTQCVRVPKVIDLIELEGENLLILEAISQNKRSGGFEEILAHQLALLHQSTTDETFGYPINNWIGATPQQNQPRTNNWREFFLTRRLAPQITLARDHGLLNKRELQTVELYVKQLESILPEHCIPSLIHGDLWSGNVLADTRGEPVLIDPAVYFAHHEAEFGMTRLFGGFSPRFESAYNEVYPFQDGADERIEAYSFYHLLNHLNLFGSSYLSSVLEIARKYQ